MKKRKNRVTAKLIIAPNDLLTKVCEPVADGEDVSDIIRDMRHILLESKTGVGLAAPQIGCLKRVILVGGDSSKTLIMLNPVIIKRSPYDITQSESCLSYPREYKDVQRSAWVRVRYQREDGGPVKHSFGEWDSRIILHEIDHLDGKCKVGVI